MNRRKLIALIGGTMIALTSCQAQPVPALEMSLEDIPALETELPEISPEEYPSEMSLETAAMENEPEIPAPDTFPETEMADQGMEEPPATNEMPKEEPPSLPEENKETERVTPEDRKPSDEENQAVSESPETEGIAGENTLPLIEEKSTETIPDTETEALPPEESDDLPEEAPEFITEDDTEDEAEEETEDPDMEKAEDGTEEAPLEDLSEELAEEGEDDLFGEETEDLFEEETEEISEKEIILEETENITDPVSRYEKGSFASGAGGYYWDESWFISSDFRFTRVDKEYALADDPSGVFVYEKDDGLSRKVGEIPYGGVVCILKDMDDNWAYIECGDIRGFVRKDAIRSGEDAEKIIRTIGEGALTQGDLLVEKADNTAFTYTKTTSYPVIADKEYAIALMSGWIYEYPDTSSRSIGDVRNGSLVYVLVEDDDGWCFVESGNVRGFIKEKMLLHGNGARKIVSDLGEDNVQLANELIGPEENRSVYYTLLSVKSAGNEIGEDICRLAVSYVGKLPYIYGGASLTSGADCSGFVQSVFAAYGIRLPRTAQEQGGNGQAVLSLDEAQPGDVIYYASGPHVGIYLGEGRVVQCSGRENNTGENPGEGPVISDVNYMPVTSIRRYLILREGTDSSGGFRTDDTPYTKEQLETIWAVVAQEDNGSYEGALAVISSAMNRTESPSWGYEGANALSQLTAPGQYCYSMDDYWVDRLGGNVPDYVRQAVDDCLRRGIRNHTHTSFRSSPGKTTGAGAVQIGGNWYFGS